MHRVTDTRGRQSDVMDQFAIRPIRQLAFYTGMRTDIEAEATVLSTGTSFENHLRLPGCHLA